MKPKKPTRPEPDFIVFANRPGVSDRLKDQIFYDVLVSAHGNLRKLLDQIVRDQQISMTKELKYFIHGALPYKPEYVVENGELILTTKLDAEAMLLSSVVEPKWFYKMKSELLNYLKEDKGKLKKCQSCNQFFSSNKVDGRIKYCAECSPKSKMSPEKRNEYQRQYRLKKRQEKENIERGARIENLMGAGYPREEAIEIIEADLKMKTDQNA